MMWCKSDCQPESMQSGISPKLAYFRRRSSLSLRPIFMPTLSISTSANLQALMPLFTGHTHRADDPSSLPLTLPCSSHTSELALPARKLMNLTRCRAFLSAFLS